MFTSSLFSFQGRLRRSEWWLIRLVVLGAFVAAIAASAVVDATIGLSEDGPAVALGLGLMALFAAVVWIELAAGVKRLHDQDFSGWMMMFILIPGIGFLFALIVLGILDGTAGPNDYGPSAKYPERSRLAAMLFD